jgi:nicotinamidase/pyrazinamidase
MKPMTKIFFDVDTQNDFMNPDGALYVPGAEKLKPNLKKLAKYAIANKITVFGSYDYHYGTEYFKDVETELSKWGGPFPDHCMEGSVGAVRIKETVDSVGEEFEKQTYDVFTNSDIRKCLQDYKVDEAVVYGVATDYCVKAAVLGMQKLGIQCYVVEDAIAGVSPETTQKAIFEMKESGATFVKTEDILSEKQ